MGQALADFMYTAGFELEYRPNKFEIVGEYEAPGDFSTYIEMIGGAEIQDLHDIEVEGPGAIITIGAGIGKSASTVEPGLREIFNLEAVKPKKAARKTGAGRPAPAMSDAADVILDRCPVPEYFGDYLAPDSESTSLSEYIVSDEPPAKSDDFDIRQFIGQAAI